MLSCTRILLVKRTPMQLPMLVHSVLVRGPPVSLSFQRLVQSFVPTSRAKPSQLSAGNGPRGLWASLYAESRSRGTEEKGQSPQRLRAVDTPLAVDCGSCVIPFPGRIPNLRSQAIRLQPGLTMNMLLYI